MSVFSKIVTGLLAGMLLLTACGTTDKIAPGRKIDYKKSKTTESLEVPPDLTSSSISDAPALLDQAATSYTEYGGSRPAGGGSTPKTASFAFADAR